MINLYSTREEAINQAIISPLRAAGYSNPEEVFDIMAIANHYLKYHRRGCTIKTYLDVVELAEEKYRLQEV